MHPLLYRTRSNCVLSIRRVARVKVPLLLNDETKPGLVAGFGLVGWRRQVVFYFCE
jgi:hypothetical protein